MVKFLVETEEELVNIIWGDPDSGSFYIIDDENEIKCERDVHSYNFGIRFLTEYEVNDKPEFDTGEFAGKEHYEIDEDLFPKIFPVIIIVAQLSYHMSKEHVIKYVYPADFEK